MMTTKIIRRYSLITIPLVVSIFISLCIRPVMIYPINTIRGIFMQGDFVLNKYRIPGTLLGTIIDSSLTISGVIIQAVIGNLPASPDAIGISKGVSLAAVTIIMTFPTAPLFVLPISSFLGAFAVSLFLSFLISKYGVKGSELALIGLATGATCTAIVQPLLIRNLLEANKALVWLTDSLYGHGMSNIYTILPWFLATVPIIILLNYRLDILDLGDTVTTALGLRVKAIKVLLLISAVILAESAISVVSGISFLGLIAPHIARQLIGNKTLHVTIISGLIGAMLLTFGDGLARSIHPPLDIPVEVIIVIIGALYFLVLLRRME